jgi:hypothetical protein
VAKRTRDWAWRRLQSVAPDGKPRPMNYRRPDYMTNAQGRTVRFHAPHPKKAVIRRFFAMTKHVVVTPGDPCLVWTGGDTFRVDDDTVTTPARFYWETMRGKLEDGDKLRRACKTPHCVKHKKLCKAKESGKSNERHI